MRYYKTINGEYIDGVGTGAGGTEITDAEYNEIMTVIRNRPKETPTLGYRLRENLTWEAYPIDPPDPDPEIDDTELLNILMGGAE